MDFKAGIRLFLRPGYEPGGGEGGGGESRIATKTLDSQRYPLAPCEYMWMYNGERASGPKRADDLCLVSFKGGGWDLSLDTGNLCVSIQHHLPPPLDTVAQRKGKKKLCLTLEK